MRANKLTSRIGIHVLLSIAMTTAAGAAPNTTGSSQGDRTVTISIDDPRPLASVIRALESRYGWVITYEDPPYMYPSDFEDVTIATRRASGPSKTRVLIPRGGQLTLEYTIPVGAGGPDASALLGQLLKDYHLSGHPGVFRYSRTGGVFHILPVESRNTRGLFEAAASLLDASISIPDGERTALRMLEAITEALSRVHGIKVGVGTVPLNFLSQLRLQGGASNESARRVLLRMLDASNRKLSWELLCDPGAPRICALNMHFVEAREHDQYWQTI